MMMMMIIQESKVENNAVELKAEDDVLLEVQQGDGCIYTGVRVCDLLVLCF